MSIYFHLNDQGTETISPTSCHGGEIAGVLHLRNDQEPGKAWQHPKMSKRRGLQPSACVMHSRALSSRRAAYRARLGREDVPFGCEGVGASRTDLEYGVQGIQPLLPKAQRTSIF